MSVQALSLPVPTIVPERPLPRPAAAIGVDLILPCYNPPDGWETALIRHYQAIAHQLAPVPLQLILVNDGSSCNFGLQHITRLETAIPDIIIVSYALNRGKGYAIREGVKRARYHHQVCTDLDFPFGIQAVTATYEMLQQGADIVAGERGDAYLQVLPASRKVLTRLSRTMNRFILQLKISDAQAGLKGFNTRGRECLLNTRVPGFLYDSEFMYKASKDPGLQIIPLPIHCRSGVRFSSFSTRLLMRELRNYLLILSTDKKNTPWPETVDY